MRFHLFLKILVSSDLSQWALHFKMFASEIEFLARTLGTLDYMLYKIAWDWLYWRGAPVSGNKNFVDPLLVTDMNKK